MYKFVRCELYKYYMYPRVKKNNRTYSIVILMRVAALIPLTDNQHFNAPQNLTSFPFSFTLYILFGTQGDQLVG